MTPILMQFSIFDERKLSHDPLRLILNKRYLKIDQHFARHFVVLR
jgi:hypothetical protein